MYIDRAYTFHGNELKMDHTPKCKHETIELSEDNIGKNLGDLRYGDNFSDITPKS